MPLGKMISRMFDEFIIEDEDLLTPRQQEHQSPQGECADYISPEMLAEIDKFNADQGHGKPLSG